MRLVSLIGIGAAAALLSACSGVPLVQHGAFAPQSKAESVQAWNGFAQDIAQKTLVAADEKAIAPEDRVVFLTGDADTTFQRGMRELLITELVNKGFSVATDPTKSHMVLQESSMYVRHSKSDDPDASTSVSPLAAVGYVLTLGMAFDPANAPTYAEVLLNSTVTVKGQVIMRDSKSFYVQPDDARTYKAAYR